MRVDFERAGSEGIKPLKSARYAERQPHEGSVFLTIRAEYITPLYEDSLSDHLTNWRQRGFRPGKIPKPWIPKSQEEVRGFVCHRVTLQAFELLQPRLDPKPMIPPKFVWAVWTPGEDFIVKARYTIHPHIPDPMQMFDLEIPLQDDPLELAKSMSAAPATTPSIERAALPGPVLPPSIAAIVPGPVTALAIAAAQPPVSSSHLLYPLVTGKFSHIMPATPTNPREVDSP
ncbi:MAG: trigger factor [bacterium]